MKLYYSPGACSMAPHIVLNESELNFSIERVDLKTKQTKDGDFRKINPKGAVPVLELDNGQILTEGAVIMQYIADQKPKANLIPAAGTFERYRCQEWLNYIATEIHKGFGPLWNDKIPEEVKSQGRERLTKQFDFVSSRLNQAHFLMQTHYTIADSYLFTLLRWCKAVGIDLSQWPTLMGHHERVKSRPATMKTLKAEGIS